ncbi:MAG: ATP-binding protein, partial [Vampirovibrionia bacterium]
KKDAPRKYNIDVFEDLNKIVLEVIKESEEISDEVLQTLFEKFKRLDDNLTRTTRGSGLGLFITKGLIEAMGGTIQLKFDEKFKAIIELPIIQEINE